MLGRDQTVEEALHEKKAEFDRLVEREKTADSMNDFFMETVKESSAGPFWPGDRGMRKSG